MMRKMLFSLVFFILVAPSVAKDIQPAEARKAGVAWMKTVPEFTQTLYLPQPDVLIIRNRANDTTLVYVLQLKPKGYILVGPATDLHPILGFSFDSDFDGTESEENHLLLLIRLDMPQRLRAMRQGRLAPGYRHRANELWQQLLQDGGHNLQQTPAELNWVVETGPFLTCRWGQGSDAYGNYVFDYYTPNHYVCGCVATALSQILYYYRWPVSGTDDYTYIWNSTPLSADFGATIYDWANMVDYYGSPAQPEIKRQAVGLLSYHTGVSVDMNYASGGSGAVTAKVASSCPNYFRCNSQWVRSDAADFWDRLYHNMIYARPAVLSIRTDTPPAGVGHAIVVDGLRHETTGPHYYHMNFGWWGSSDGWYDISGNFDAGGYTWQYKEGAVLDIFPQPDLADPGALLYSSSFAINWEDGPVGTPDKYELQQALLDPISTTFSDDAESGLGNWLIRGNWKSVTNAYHSSNHSFKGYIAETTTDINHFSSIELDKALKITSSTQISYYWGAYAFDYSEARCEISTDEKNWTALRTHTSTAKSFPPTWNAVTISAGELSPYVGNTALLRFIVRLTGSSYYYGTTVGFYLDDINVQNVNIGQWSTVDNNITELSKQVTVGQSGDYLYRVRPYSDSRWWDWSDVEAVHVDLPANVTLQVKALLDGPYQGGGIMSTTLRDQGLIPNDSPYPQAPATVPSIPANVTDWILLQLYESDGATVAQSVSVFIRNDGWLVDLNGSTSLSLSGVYKTKNYYVVLKHRNHIRAMSAHTVNFNTGSASYDFTDTITKYYGSNGAKSLAGGFWGLWAGDIDQSGTVDDDDFALWQTSGRSGASGYNNHDVRLDGNVTSRDYVFWYENARAGAATGMPHP